MATLTSLIASYVLAAALPIEQVKVPEKSGIQLGTHAGSKGAPNVSWEFAGAPKDGFDGVRVAISPREVHGDKNFVYWAYDGVFMNNLTYYAGLQPKGEFGKTALFSVFGSGTHPKAPHCKAGADMGSGTSCHIPYEWKQGGAYELTIQQIAKDDQGSTWEGAIVDLATRERTVIGVVSVGKERGLLKPWAVTFIEYFRHVNSCAEQPFSEVLFYRPVAYRGGKEFPANIKSMNLNSGCTPGFYGDGKSYVYVDLGAQ
jgi:hypothetical protein